MCSSLSSHTRRESLVFTNNGIVTALETLTQSLLALHPDRGSLFVSTVKVLVPHIFECEILKCHPLRISMGELTAIFHICCLHSIQMISESLFFSKVEVWYHTYLNIKFLNVILSEYQ